MSGSIVIEIDLSRTGATTKASFALDGALPDDAAKCLVDVLSALEFDTEGALAVLEVTLTFHAVARSPTDP